MFYIMFLFPAQLNKVLSGNLLLLFISLKYPSAKYCCTNFPSKPLILYCFMPNICCILILQTRIKDAGWAVPLVRVC